MTTGLRPEAARILQLLHAGQTVQEVERLTATPGAAIRTLVGKQHGWLIDASGRALNPGARDSKVKLPDGVDPLAPAELAAILRPTPPARPQRPAAAGGVDVLIAEAEQLPDTRVQGALRAVRTAVGVLRELVQGAAERSLAEAEVARLRQQLADAEVRLKELGGNPRRAAVSATGPTDREIRAWFAEQGLECPQNGRLPKPYREQYAAAHGGGS